jgi:hypothetical protein
VELGGAGNKRQQNDLAPPLAAEVDLDHIPELLGEMEQLRAILWARLPLRITRSDPAGRTHKLLKTLVASRGVKGVDDDRLSMIDRFRLLASAYLSVTDAIGSGPEHASNPAS